MKVSKADFFHQQPASPMNTKTSNYNAAFSLLSLIAIVFVLYILKPLIMPILYASILAIMIFPIQKFLEKFHQKQAFSIPLYYL